MVGEATTVGKCYEGNSGARFGRGEVGGGSPSDTKQLHEVDVRVFEYPEICRSQDLSVMSNILVFSLLFLAWNSAPG